jgi:hypothetical protein
MTQNTSFVIMPFLLLDSDDVMSSKGNFDSTMSSAMVVRVVQERAYACAN